jgi:hypothetical protein
LSSVGVKNSIGVGVTMSTRFLKPLSSVHKIGTTTEAATSAIIARAANRLRPLATAAPVAREQ